MEHQAKKKGFTLVELMIVVAIIAILVALALPSYTRYTRKANRGEAQQLLMNWANNKEIWRANNPTYDDNGAIPDPTMSPARYIFSESNVTATTYTLSAVAQGDQTKDEDKGVNCTTLTINQSNTKGPVVSNVSFCW